MYNSNNIFETIGTQQEYNYYGHSYTGMVKSVRKITTAFDTYEVRIGEHVVTTDYAGRGVAYNGYSTAFVKCEDNPETRAAVEMISKVMPENMVNAIKATFKAPAV